MTTCYQVNLREGWGGAEIYTASFTHALMAAGIKVVLFVHPGSPYWENMLPVGCTIIKARNYNEVLAHLPERSWLMFQVPLYEEQATLFRHHGHFLTAVAHMTLFGRTSSALSSFDWMAGDSQYVLDTGRATGLTNFHPEPLWCLAELENRMGENDAPIIAACPYGWDPRKGRDRLLSLLYPIYEKLSAKKIFAKEPGLTLGIVSRLADPKQFPLLLSYIAPILAKHKHIRLEIIGDGGYAMVRDIRIALRPIRDRTRFWGYQKNVGSIYRKLDYVLAGLPEKEAFGLNLVEAQICGTPVLAINAPPFSESVSDGVTGFLYQDPRTDAGAGFEKLIATLAADSVNLNSPAAKSYLSRFSEKSFQERVARFIETTLTVRAAYLTQHFQKAHQ